MERYLPPAGIDDFSRSARADDLRKGWHDRVSTFLGQVLDPAMNELASPLFYDQLGDTSGVPDGEPQGIPWNGFPLRLTKWFSIHPPQARDELANRAAETVLRLPVFGLRLEDGSPLPLPFRVQDEYCEWHVERDGGTIRRIFFTCEPPEYWEFLASQDFDLVHRLYRELLHNDSIPKDDLRWPFDVFRRRNGQLVRRYRRGDYNPWNVWNTERGAIHLTHPANSLFAEMALASDGTLGWPVAPDAQGQIDPQALMCCAGRGGINRSSDPLILRGVFNFARAGLAVALANPIGLYMAPFTLGGLLNADEEPVGEACLSLPRRSTDSSRVLRAEVAPPEGAGFTLDQCTLDGQELRHGGQIARGITMRLFGVAKRIPGRNPRLVMTCPQFCCSHPTHPDFRGTFPFSEFGSCDDVMEEDWRSEAFDVPDFPDVEAEPLGRAAILAANLAETAAAPEVEIMDPQGRRVSATRPVIEIEDL